jgi:hypothetical protein
MNGCPRRAPRGPLTPHGVLRWACLVALVCPGTAAAQMLQALGGTSTVNNATGGTVLVRGAGYEASLGAGEIQGRFRIGTLVRVKRQHYTFSGGDEALGLTLPTDPTGAGSYLPLRAVGVTAEGPNGTLVARAGYSTVDVGTSFFSGAESQRPAAVLFADRRLGPSWRFFTRNILADTRTAIQGVEWHQSGWLLAGAGGVAASDPYLAVRARMSTLRVASEITYVAAGSPFRDLVATRATTAERTGANVSLTVTPSARWSVRGLHEQLVAPSLDNSLVQRTVDQVHATADAGGTRFSAGMYGTSGEGRHNVGSRVSAGRRLGERWDVATEYYSSSDGGEPASHSVITTVRQTIGPRLSAVQVISRNDGHTNVRAGGSVISNFATVGVDYQTTYAPFAGRSPFVNTLVLSARVNPLSDWQLQVTTYTLPNGVPRYTLSASRFFYRTPSASPASSRQASNIPKYLVRGRVVDEVGRGVGGAVLNVGGDIVIAAEDGQFFVRSGRRRPLVVSVPVDEFPRPYRFSVISAPPRVTPSSDDSQVPLTIVVRRIDG